MSASVLQNVIQPKPGTGHAGWRQQVEDEPVQDSSPEEMESVLGVLVENAPVAMAMFDCRMRYVLANRAWIEEFSLQEVRPLIGRSQYEIFPGMHPGWREVYERALNGHIVRSEHDELGGQDGQRLVYRWEVRPWRRNRDASVGGLMVTCEKFAALPAAAEAAVEREGTASPNPPPEIPPAPEMPASALPLVLVDEGCVIHQANAAAVELCLARGLQEGCSLFAEMFTSGRDMAAFQSLWQKALDKLEGGASGAVLLVHGAHERMSGESELPERWLLSPSGKAAGKTLLLAVGLPRQPGYELAPRPILPATGPDLPAIASAVASIRQPAALPVAGAAEGAAPNFELRRLQDDLARARQEMRTLREAEHLFSQKETRLRHYLNTLPCGVLVLDELGSPVFQNEPLARLLGRPVKKEETVEQWLAAACADAVQKEEVAAVWREDVWRRQLTRVFSLATADGLLKELEFQPCGLPGGGLLVCIQDATERCRHEEQLRATEAKFRALFQEAPVAAVLADRTGAVFEANHHAESLLGRSKSELRRLSLDAWLDAPSIHKRREALHHMLRSGERSTTLEAGILREGAEPLPCLLTLAQVLDSDGSPHQTMHFLQPAGAMPAGKTTPAPLGGAKMMSQAPPMEDGAEVFLLKTNVNGRIKECSPRGRELLGLAEGQERGRALHLHFRPSDATGFYQDLLASAGEAREMECLTADGARKACRLLARKTDGGGWDADLFEVTRVPAIEPGPEAMPEPAAGSPQPVPAREPWPATDLSREKLLLSETHHRIKNHLQIISSLLNLESNTLQDPAARGVLRSSQNRVRAIAELHQHLYQLALGTGAGFAEFAGELVRRLRECFDVPESKAAVELRLEEGGIQQEWLMPLALVLNETLSNSFEHAFPGERTGKIQVTLTFHPEGGLLSVKDDGIGIPEGESSSSNQGLGLKILSVFAEQMRGRLEIKSPDEGGTEILLRFSIASADI